MIDRNMATFDSRWNRNAQPLASFTQVREPQRHLEEVS
jgi:hypothetical protein